MQALLVLGAITLAGLPLLASGDRPDAQPAAKTVASSPLVSKPERRPFSTLFQGASRPSEPPKLVDPVGVTPVPPRVVCGLVILDAKRDIDPRAIVPVPPGNFAIRRIEPSVCHNQ